MDVDMDEKWLVQEILALAKEHGIKVLPPGAPVDPDWLNEKSLFRMSGIRADGMIEWLSTLKEASGWSIEERLKNLLEAKDSFKEFIGGAEISALLKSAFHVDGSVKISDQEIKDLTLVSYGAQISPSDVQQEVERILSRFAYPVGRDFCFRGPSYYFMFEGVDVNMKTKSSSINDYEVVGLDYARFARSLLEHYNQINDSLYFVARHLMAAFFAQIPAAKDPLCKDLLNKLASKKLKALRKKATSGDHFIGHENTDQFFEQQWGRVLDELDELRQLVGSYRKKGSNVELDPLLAFITCRSSAIRHAKMIFGVDIDAIFNKHIKLSPSRQCRKLLLGLLDAKINILAFLQNASQILYSHDFLNPDFTGDLVFKRDVVTNMSRECPGVFREFKESQEAARFNEKNLSLLAELEEATALYMDVLLNDNSASYHRLIGLPASDDALLTHSLYGPCPIELRDSVALMGCFFNFLNTYYEAFEDKQLKRQAKNQARGKPFKKSETHLVARRDAWVKLIRIYREENDPLVMVLTAQQAMSVIKRKGFDPKRDVLHPLSVNYGGALVGMYAKHTFSRMVLGGQLMANTGALTYSIYDVKRNGSFFKLSDYPYSSIASDVTLDQRTKQKLKSENWLLIFDDNTNSGETVDNIRQLAVESEIYGRIDTFTCRANPNIEKYKPTLTPEQRIDIVGVAGLRLRKLKVTGGKERYKEIIGTIVGHRLSKIIRSCAKSEALSPPLKC